jgi:hypothetical protein
MMTRLLFATMISSAFAVIPAHAQSDKQSALKDYFLAIDNLIIDFDASAISIPAFQNCRFVQELQRRGSSLSFCLFHHQGQRMIAHECRQRDAGTVSVFGNLVTLSAGWGTWGGMRCTFRMQPQGNLLSGTMSCTGNGSSGCPPHVSGASIPIKMQFR